ncbi:MAG: bifunctional 2-C-methyl-D-erythritol 4-phosphate cytidylyltransferase/2-C-methyl-D-erythritol 2,4-cyclodiphosphate synthase [Hyphomicrobiales bacterium]|nr:bifunctional 2-C-methyl-D-erythritol 4-phosphate cytidylyltransferase/2-C-methyl-D-erythritol 2,4-cyclodiphosphate synthase [Hyphomicrobiales bacterium]PCH50606.1 MAG: bifunctional 2-C-methyl-D-erythritol 4-phosphate cytidylyltransferase/2-C-methyl-D-erythritol 2,4-cyclodiphosphate synthase [Hyphomicrobiales bacterium]
MSGVNTVVIVAGGRGTRVSTSPNVTPKQYQDLNGKTVLQRAIDQFINHEEIHFIQVVIHKDDSEIYKNTTLPDEKLLEPVFGGASRQQSCAQGLIALSKYSPDKVLIHDAARPFVSYDIISNTLSNIRSGKCALPATKIADTIKRANSQNIVEETVPRDNLYLAQTPQGFVYSQIHSAHLKARAEGLSNLTDDAALAEWAGMDVSLVESEASNTKITTIDDLNNAKKILDVTEQFKIPDLRVGNGYDVHRLIDGDGVILCGIKIPSDKKLDGHSDADVAMHALTDALLGTIGAGDIGSHFPPSNPKWKGASSDQFLIHACKLVRAKNGTITHMDITIICEFPKIGPFRETMRENIAAICKLPVERVSVKATTNEEIGSIGRGEGIASIATATAVFMS